MKIDPSISELSDDEVNELLNKRMKELLLRGAEAVEILRPHFGPETLTAATGAVALLLPLTDVPFSLYIQMLGLSMGMNIRVDTLKSSAEADRSVTPPKSGGDVN